MITYMPGSILETECEALVNTVNCVGVAGRGLALAVRQRWPQWFDEYRVKCRAGAYHPGRLDSFNIWLATPPATPGTIVDFPTKDQWQDPSQLAWITTGMGDLCHIIEDIHISSVAIPKLGAGLGGLDWVDVHAEMIHALNKLDENVRVEIYGEKV